MWSVVIVEAQPGRQGAGPLGRGAVDGPVGPALGEGLDEALGLAVGAGPVGPGAAVADAQLPAGVPVKVRAVGRAVVGEDPLDRDPLGGEPGQRPPEKGAGALLALVGQHLGVGHPRGAVDGDVHALPAAAPALTLARAGDPVPGARDAPQLLDVDVHQLARARGLEAVGGLGRIEPSQAPQAGAGANAAHRALGDSQAGGDLVGGHARPAQADHRALALGGGGARDPVRAAGAILEPAGALGAVAGQPLAGGPLVLDAAAQQEPGRGRQLGVSVKLHPGLPGERMGQHPRSSRLARMNNVLAPLS